MDLVITIIIAYYLSRYPCINWPFTAVRFRIWCAHDRQRSAPRKTPDTRSSASNHAGCLSQAKKASHRSPCTLSYETTAQGCYESLSGNTASTAVSLSLLLSAAQTRQQVLFKKGGNTRPDQVQTSMRIGHRSTSSQINYQGDQ